MTPLHKSDAQLQAAALHHYALKCRAAADQPENTWLPKEKLLANADRADQLARVYERLAGDQI